MESWRPFLEGFILAWMEFANCLLKKEGLRVEDVKVCKDAFTVLGSDVPERLFKEVNDSPVVFQSTLDEAEEFDKALLRRKMIVLAILDEYRRDAEVLGEKSISLQKMLLMSIVRKQGRLILE